MGFLQAARSHSLRVERHLGYELYHIVWLAFFVLSKPDLIERKGMAEFRKNDETKRATLPYKGIVK